MCWALVRVEPAEPVLSEVERANEQALVSRAHGMILGWHGGPGHHPCNALQNLRGAVFARGSPRPEPRDLHSGLETAPLLHAGAATVSCWLTLRT
ncbi:MAG: hypothetical protein KatS3mg059_0970 [Thermomicrobiales bacterium]|nr:MAG: hypothetical protein KatS3mg059_0970 [Thermomicrobiales bacterium]